MNRPVKDDYYLDIARTVSSRSTCLRRRYGAVIVKDDVIISTGYNGACRGEANCIDLNRCERKANNIPHGERYELCRAVHAEMNAVISAGREAVGATLYLWGCDENGVEVDAEPCELCKRVIANARIKRTITK